MKVKHLILVGVTLFLVVLVLVFLSGKEEGPVQTAQRESPQGLQKAQRGKISRLRPVKTSKLKEEAKKPKPAHPEMVPDYYSLLPSEWCTDEIYNEEGTLIEMKFDLECDGTLDHCDTFTYDEEGNRTMTEVDENCDGTVDRCSNMDYDEYGGITRYQNDHGCDGKPDRRPICFDREYNEQGFVSVRKIDMGCDGKYVMCTTLSYNASGSKSFAKNDIKCDGNIEDCHTEILDAEGRRVAFLSDRGCDETWDRCSFNEYTESGDVMKEEIEGDCHERLTERGLVDK